MWNLERLNKNIDTRIAGTRLEYVFQEFIRNTALFPPAVILLRIDHAATALPGILAHFAIMLCGALLQAVYVGSRDFERHPRFILGSLIAPSFCTGFHIVSVGLAQAVLLPEVQLYWVYSLAIGVLQALRFRVRGHFAHLVILVKGLVRAGVLILLFGLFHVLSGPHTRNWAEFFSAPDHIYAILLIMTFGTLVGLADINAFRYLNILRTTAHELRLYSEWLLGAELLSRTVGNPTVLSQRRNNRTVVFMDIRGFTQWSGNKPPEDVVTLIDLFFRTGEQALSEFRAFKVELTGDEIFAVFRSPREAAMGAMAAMEALRPTLTPHGLGMGAGINTGPVIEGLVGGNNLKKYAVMGDTVNIGRRICDVAGPEEILISESVRGALPEGFRIGPPINVKVKGRAEELGVFRLQGLADTQETNKGWRKPVLEVV